MQLSKYWWVNRSLISELESGFHLFLISRYKYLEQTFIGFEAFRKSFTKLATKFAVSITQKPVACVNLLYWGLGYGFLIVHC